MTRFDPERLAGTYAVAQRMVDDCLRTDGSLFTPSLPIWSRANFEELERDYVQAPDTTKRSFLDKLRDQVGDPSAGAMQLAAELLYALYLPSSGSMGVTASASRSPGSSHGSKTRSSSSTISPRHWTTASAAAAAGQASICIAGPTSRTSCGSGSSGRRSPQRSGTRLWPTHGPSMRAPGESASRAAHSRMRRFSTSSTAVREQGAA